MIYERKDVSSLCVLNGECSEDLFEVISPSTFSMLWRTNMFHPYQFRCLAIHENPVSQILLSVP